LCLVLQRTTYNRKVGGPEAVVWFLDARNWRMLIVFLDIGAVGW